MPQVTVDGLVDNPETTTAIQEIQWADAGGGADAITVACNPEVDALSDGLPISFRATAANLTATPTLNVDGLGAYTIKKAGGVALTPGNIPGDNAEMLVRYNLASTYWELLNPYETPKPAHVFAAGSGTNSITATFSPAYLTTNLFDGTLFRVRAANDITSATVTFAPDGLTARSVVRADGSALQIGDILANQDMFLVYDSANTRYKLLNPAGASVFYKALTSDDTGGTNVNTAQPWFPTAGAVTLPVGTYDFEGFLFLSRSAGTTSHTTGTLFGGTATIGQIAYTGMAKTGDANDLQSWSGFLAVAATSLVVKAASTSATEQVLIRVFGELTITVAGTLIPQFIYSAAPGGAPTIKAGTWFRLTKRTNPSGTWA